MPRTRSTVRAVTLAALVALSMSAGSFGLAGSVSAAASGLGIETDQPIAGEGRVTVRVDVTPGANVSFKLQDSDGAISATETVTDGGSEDSAALDGVVETTLNLSRLYDTPPASGTGIIYAGQGDGFSIPQQGYTSKVQVAIDADDPTAAVTSDAAAKAGTEVSVGYTATDVPQKVASITMRISNDSGVVYKTVTGLQTGTDTGAQFTVPSYTPAGEYDVELVVVDEVGHTSTALRHDALNVTASSSDDGGKAVNVGAMELVSSQPVNGTGNFSVTVAAEETVSFKVLDAEGNISATETVTDGSSEDLAETKHTIVTELNLSRLYEDRPASGTAVVYAGNGTSFSIANQTYEDKRQFALDADRPTAALTHGDTGKSGQGVKIGYEAADVPQKTESVTLHVIGPNGTHYYAVEGLQGGTDRTAQFTIPETLPAGNYTLTLEVVDEVGYRATATLHDGLVVKQASGSSSPVSGLALESAPPAPGAGTVNVSVVVSPGSNATFRLQDAAGTTSATKTVSDGGPRDDGPSSGVIETALNLSTLFDQPPESGTGIIYANDGDSLSIAQQTFDDKLQVSIDADAPTATVDSGVRAETGQQVKIGYSATDVPQKLDAVVIRIVGSDGLIYHEVDRLQAGQGKKAEFIVPGYMPAGEYDIELVAIDEVGHRATDTMTDGFVVTEGDTGDGSVTVSALDIRTAEPVRGTGDIVVEASVDEVGANVSFKVQDVAGTVSATKTVTDGGPGDAADRYAAVVRTTLNLSELYADRPASGDAIVYTGGGSSFSISDQTYDSKRQLMLDADAPTAELSSGGSAEPGTQVSVGYSATDVPQKVSTVTLQVVGEDGTVYTSISGLQGGEGRTAQFVVPYDLDHGQYDLRLVVTDEVGHRTTDTLHDGLTVESRSS